MVNYPLSKSMSEQTPHVSALFNKLNSIPSGAVSGDLRDKVLRLLESCWHELQGGQQTSMEPWKVCRAEDLRWDPPVLSFTIERHGAFVLGSTRGDLHEWKINLETLTASCYEGRYRQLIPKSPKLDVNPIAARVCEAVQQGPESKSPLVQQEIVVWAGNDNVSIKHGALVSGDNQRTISSRRSRFRRELTDRMKALGWDFVAVRRLMIFKRSQAC